MTGDTHHLVVGDDRCPLVTTPFGQGLIDALELAIAGSRCGLGVQKPAVQAAKKAKASKSFRIILFIMISSCRIFWHCECPVNGSLTIARHCGEREVPMNIGI